jgi:hypothetical protein
MHAKFIALSAAVRDVILIWFSWLLSHILSMFGCLAAHIPLPGAGVNRLVTTFGRICMIPLLSLVASF